MKKIILGFSNLIELIVRIYIIYFITKYLGIELYGYFSYIISLGMLFSVLFMYGIGPTLLQYYDKDKNLFSTLILITLINLIILFPLLYLYDRDIGILSVFNYLILLLMYINNSQGKVYYYAFIKIVTYVTILIFLVIKDIESVSDIIDIYVYTSAYLVVVYLFEIRKFLFWKTDFELRNLNH